MNRHEYFVSAKKIIGLIVGENTITSGRRVFSPPISDIMRSRDRLMSTNADKVPILVRCLAPSGKDRKYDVASMRVQIQATLRETIMSTQKTIGTENEGALGHHLQSTKDTLVRRNLR